MRPCAEGEALEPGFITSVTTSLGPSQGGKNQLAGVEISGEGGKAVRYCVQANPLGGQKHQSPLLRASMES